MKIINLILFGICSVLTLAFNNINVNGASMAINQVAYTLQNSDMAMWLSTLFGGSVQTNTPSIAMSEEEWEELKAQNPTLYGNSYDEYLVQQQVIADTNNHNFNIFLMEKGVPTLELNQSVVTSPTQKQLENLGIDGVEFNRLIDSGYTCIRESNGLYESLYFTKEHTVDPNINYFALSDDYKLLGSLNAQYLTNNYSQSLVPTQIVNYIDYTSVPYFVAKKTYDYIITSLDDNVRVAFGHRLSDDYLNVYYVSTVSNNHLIQYSFTRDYTQRALNNSIVVDGVTYYYYASTFNKKSSVSYISDMPMYDVTNGLEYLIRGVYSGDNVFVDDMATILVDENGDIIDLDNDALTGAISTGASAQSLIDRLIGILDGLSTTLTNDKVITNEAVDSIDIAIDEAIPIYPDIDIDTDIPISITDTIKNISDFPFFIFNSIFRPIFEIFGEYSVYAVYIMIPSIAIVIVFVRFLLR